MKNYEEILQVVANGGNGVENIQEHYYVGEFLHVVVLELNYNMLNSLANQIIRMEHDKHGIEVVFEMP